MVFSKRIKNKRGRLISLSDRGNVAQMQQIFTEPKIIYFLYFVQTTATIQKQKLKVRNAEEYFQIWKILMKSFFQLLF